MEKLSLKDIAGFCKGRAPENAGDIFVADISTDSRSPAKGSLFIPLIGERFDGHDFIGAAAKAGAAAALCSKDNIESPIPLIFVPDTHAALLDIARAYRRRFKVRTVGVTGSVGKTTTKEIIHSVLSQRFPTLKNEGNLNNDIGVPISLLKLDKSHKAAVFEMGMNHFGEISELTRLVCPDIAVITGIGLNHIEYLGSREGILKAKLEILEGLNPGGIAVFNGDEPLLWNLKGRLGTDIIYYGIENNMCDVCAADIRAQDGGMAFSIKAPGALFDAFIPMAGRHNVYNSLAAAAAGLHFGLEPDEISAGLLKAANTGMRQHIFSADGITVIEDCYNASPDSMAAALGVLSGLAASGRKMAALGGMLELGNSSEQAHVRVGGMAAACADILFLYGEGAPWYREGALTEGMPPENARVFNTHADLAKALKAEAAAGDAVLFKGSRGMHMETALKLFLGEEK